MAVSLNSVSSFNPTLQGNYQQVTGSNIRATLPKIFSNTSLRGSVGPRQSIQEKRSHLYRLAVTSGGNIVTETTNEDSKSSDEDSSNNTSNIISSEPDEKVQPSEEISAEKSSLPVKQAPLTARERLRAARVLNRYTESKPTSTPGLGIKLMDSLRETDKGKKRPGLPEAPTNLLDDSKRGLSKGAWTVDLSSGMDVIVIIFSFVFISTVMFATTFLVWKLGAIHFNEN